MEPVERLGGKKSDVYPLHLVSPQPGHRLHSQMDHSKHAKDAKIDGKEVLRIHPSAAAARNIQERDTVRVFNDRGACLAVVMFDANRRDDVVSLPTGAWYKPDFSDPEVLEMNGNPNVLTPDIGTSSLAQGPSSSTCLVEVERYGE